MEDKELIRACLAGKADMQAALYHRFAGKMFGICLRYAGTTAEAEDILQQGFIKVFLNLSRYREGSLEGWIRKIIVHEAIDIFRKRKRDLVEIQEVMTENFVDESAGILEKLSAESLMNLIKELPGGCRIIFNLYAIEGYSHSEIAEMLQISEGNSRTQFHRARLLLKEKIKADQYSYGKRETPEHL
jgi:RNA polymerase sigma-70 factor (ECF subfamily)